MIQKLRRDERGELSFFSIFIIIAINMIMAFLLLFASIRIEGINIRNAAKMELNNVSARIYADTFHSQREANLDSYMADLHFSSAYQEALRAGFLEGFNERVPLRTDDYTVNGITLSFQQYEGKIEYQFNCDLEFRIQMFGDSFPPIRKHITLTGSHNTKY